MSDAVTIALITVVGGGFLTILGTLVAKVNHVGKRVNQVGKDATIAREQTQNSHDINLRDDIDKKHKETHDTLGIVLEQIKGLQTSDNNQWAAIEEMRRKRSWFS